MSLMGGVDSTGRNRGPVTVTAQNVSHWFQNRRRKDNHPEIEEKRVKKRSARMKRQSAPLDLTQQASPSPPPSSSSVAAAAADAADAGDCYDQRRPPADSDDDAGARLNFTSSPSLAKYSSSVRSTIFWPLVQLFLSNLVFLC